MDNIDNKYTSSELMKIFNIKKGSWYNLKNKFNLDLYAEKIIENNKTKYLYNEQVFEILKSNCSSSCTDCNDSNNSSNIVVYQNQIIEMYKKENDYLKQENKRLLDIIAVKEQKELAKDIKQIGHNETVSLWYKLFHKIKK